MKNSKIKRIVLGATMITLIGVSTCGCSSEKPNAPTESATQNTGIALEKGARTREEAVEIWLEAQNNKDWDLYKTILPTPLVEDEDFCKEQQSKFENDTKDAKELECLGTQYLLFEDEDYKEHCADINNYFEMKLDHEVEDIAPEELYRLYIAVRPVDASDDTPPHQTYYYVYKDGGRYFVSVYLGEFSFGG